MKSLWKKLIILAVAASVVAALIHAYIQRSKERAAEAAGEQAITSESRVRQDSNGNSFVNLDPNTQRLIGLQTTALIAATRKQEVKGFGRALDQTALVGLLGEIASARVALEASSKEYQRVKTLFGQDQNASAKALETADAAMKRDEIALNTAKAQLVTAWGEAIAERPDLPDFVQSLSKLKTVLVRLDLPSGEALRETPTGARLIIPGQHNLSKQDMWAARPPPMLNHRATAFSSSQRTSRRVWRQDWRSPAICHWPGNPSKV